MSDTVRMTLEDLDGRLARDLAALAEATGGPLRYADIRRLADKAADIRRIEEGGAPGDADPAALLPRQVTVGSVTLHAPTIAVEILLERASGWEDAPGPWLDRFVAYLHAHARDRGALERVTDPDAARPVVDEWAAGLTCTPDELYAAIRKLTLDALVDADGEDEDDGGDPDSKKATGPDSSGP